MSLTARDLSCRLQPIWGLAKIELLERVGETRGRKLTSASRQLKAREAARDVRPLAKWNRISDSSFSAYTNEATLVRLNKLRDLIPHGSRVLDVGIGYGYVTGVVLSEVRPSYYCGIDIKENFLEATRDMMRSNDLDDPHVALEVKSIFDIDEEFASRHDPDLILILEVLEHVSNPTEALQAVCRAVGPDKRILFTVPLRGRLDGVWGHASVFDRRRLQRMCRAAGLTIERAEPLHNTWSLVLARTGELSSSASSALVDDGRAPYTFTPVPITGSAEQYRRPADPPEVEVRRAGPRLHCVVGADNGARHGGGVRLAMASPKVARMEVSIDPPDQVRRLEFHGLDAQGVPRLEWSTQGESAGLHTGRRKTYVLRPGVPTRGLQPQAAEDPDDVCWMEVNVEPQPGTGLTLTVHRAAYLPGREG